MPRVEPLTPEVLRAALEAFAKYGNNIEAAKSLGLNVQTYKTRKQKAIAAGHDDKLVAMAPTGHRIKGVSTFHGPDGSISGQWIKTTVDARPVEEIIEIIQAAFDEWVPPDALPQVKQKSSIVDDGLATVYPVADWHVGLLAWNKETGEDWDLPIAQKIIADAFDELVGRTPPSEQAVILGLGDLLHSDGYENTTARSKNLLDVDGRWPKVLRVATGLLIHCVERARQNHGKVLVRVLPGNHDEESAIAVALALSLYYRDTDGVEVDTDPSRFWWWRWGATLLGATHGDKAKMKDLPLLMAARRPGDWGGTKYHSIYTGHIHTDTGIEMAGVKVESFQTPAAPDAWHDSMGYGAGRSLTSITIDKERGEVGRSRAIIDTGA
mgnify:CR=1 FL=1